MMDHQHKDHKYMFIKYFMTDDHDEITRIFDTTFAECIRSNRSNRSNRNMNLFVETLDLRISKLMDEREEEMRQPFEIMISDYRLSVEQLKNDLYERFNVKDLKDIDCI